MTFSDAVSKPILNFQGLQNYYQVLVLLGKLQQAAGMTVRCYFGAARLYEKKV